MKRDVVVVGGGPAGLALAANAAKRGLDVVLLERGELPADKPCGEGLMPAGVRALEALGARRRLSDADCTPFTGLRYVQEDGRQARAILPFGGGLGIRRIALSSALFEVAREQGATIRPKMLVRGFTRERDRVVVRTDEGEIEAGILVAADGLHSRIRRDAGLEGPPQPVRRFGMRRHVRLPPWCEDVEVHFTEGAEAYVTPCGAERVGVAFLFEHGRVPPRVRFELLLERFPVLRTRLAGAAFDSEVRGSGSLWHQPRSRTADRLVLLGDAAGYIDALTGEGVSLALQGAEALAAVLPDALTRGGERRALLPFERACDRAWRRYAVLTRSMLALARRPGLRRVVLRVLERHPGMFNRLVAAALG